MVTTAPGTDPIGVVMVTPRPTSSGLANTGTE